tara:strand:- start:212 stop:820 length:609 start_codon:yes stop_codon:yes gene_type:complete
MHLIKKMIKKLLSILLLISISLSPLQAIESSPLSIGSDEAKVTVKVFSSLTCPHCATFHDKIFKNLKIDFIDKKKVKFEHHGFPLDLAALNAEKVLRSVSDEERSFKFLTEIYKKQNQWAVGSDINKINILIKKMSLDFGIKEETIDKFIKDDKIQDQILEERIAAQKNYKISSTPTIYINDKKYDGKHNYRQFKKEIERLL